MFARTTMAELDPVRMSVDDAVRVFKESVIPALHKQDGYEGSYVFVASEGKALVLQVGFSHPVKFIPPAGVSIKVDNPTRLTVSGADRAEVGQVAADIRGIRPPEPYKGKGIKYEGEYIRRKAGKTAGSVT